MANAIGTGMLPLRTAPSTPCRESAPAPIDPDAEARIATFGRIRGLLELHDHGLTATELRGMLAEPIERVQRVLAEAVTARRVRRLGARRNMRYVLNA